jgi:HK97 family phage portal protein
VAVLATTRGNVDVSPFRQGFSQRSDWFGAGWVPLVGQDRAMTYAGLYKTQPFLRAAVDKMAKGIARLPLQGFQRNGDDREQLRDHPLADVLERPNAEMGCYRWKEHMAGELALHGNSVSAILGGSNGIPTSFWPFPWQFTEIRGEDRPRKYIFHTPMGEVVFDADRVFHLRFWSPDTDRPFAGSSLVEPLRRMLMNDDAAARWSTAMFKNAGRPSGFYVTDKSRLNEEQAASIRENAAAIYGGVDNAGRIGVLAGGLDWKETQLDVVETGLLELRQLNREEVASAYDIPPPLLQDLKRATFSNITEQHRMFYQGTLPPWLTLFEEEFQSQVIDRVSTWGDLFVEFELAEVLKGDPKSEAETLATERRWLTINEIRRIKNLPPINLPGYDEVWEPINETPIGSSGQPALPPGPPPKAVMLRALERAEQIGRSRLGGHNGKVFDSERFARELIEDLRDPDAKGWAELVADSVAGVLENAETVTDLAERLRLLKETLV